jgi:hypothetical protein
MNRKTFPSLDREEVTLLRLDGANIAAVFLAAVSAGILFGIVAVIRAGMSNWFLLPLLLIDTFVVLGLLDTIQKSRLEIGVDSKGISAVSSKGSSMKILWDEVTRLQHRRVLQEMVVTGKDAKDRIRVDYSVERFDELRLLLYRALAKNRGPLTHLPLRLSDPLAASHNYFVLSPVFVALGVFAFFVRDTSLGVAITFALLPVGFVIAAVINSRKFIIIERETFSLVAPMKSVEQYKFSDIRTISTGTATNYRSGNRFFALDLGLNNGQAIRLSRRYGEIPELYWVFTRATGKT